MTGKQGEGPDIFYHQPRRPANHLRLPLVVPFPAGDQLEEGIDYGTTMDTGTCPVEACTTMGYHFHNHQSHERGPRMGHRSNKEVNTAG
jgi:hypothetical protein